MRRRTLDLYVLREVVGPFLAGLLFLVQLFFVVRLLSQADVIFGSSLSAGDLGKLLLYLLPSMLSYGLPIAFLLGILVGLGRLGDDRELTALAATGHGPHRLLPAPLLTAFVLTAFMLFITTWLEPVALKNANSLLRGVIKRNLAGDVKPGVFYEDLSDLTIFAGQVDRKTGALRDVLVSDAREPSEPLLLLSEQGHIDTSGPGGSLVLQLERGEVHRTVAGGPRYSLATFRTAEVAVGVDEEISHKSRRRPMEDLTPREIREREHREDGSRTPEYETELYRRFSHPFVLLAFALIGVAVAGGKPGGSGRGRAIAFAWTLGAVVAYFVLDRVGVQLGKRAVLPPALAAFSPSLILAAVGTSILVWRTRVG